MKTCRTLVPVSGLAAGLFLLLFAAPAYSQYFSTNDGDWTNGSTWVGGSAPVDGNFVGIGGSNSVTFSTGTYTTGGWDAGKYLAVGWNSGPNPGAGILNITGGTLNADGLAMGHETRAGTINQSGGIFNVYGVNTLIGWGSTSTINISGGTMNMTGGAGVFRIGHVSASSVNISGTGVANLSGTIGLASGSTISANGGTLNISNATLDVTAGSSLIARSNGVINMLEGTQTIGVVNALWLGTDATTGTLNLSGGTWTQNSFVRMGVYASGNGIINQTGGTFEMGGTFEAWGSSPSAYNLSGGTFRTLTNGVQINSYSGGAMTFNITGSSGDVTMDTPYNFTAPNSSVFNNAAATLTKTGEGTLTVAGQLDVRNGALSIQNGTIETVTATFIGTEGGTAAATMTNGTLKTGYLGAANFSVGRNGGTGTFTQSDGAIDVGALANVVFGWSEGSVGTYVLNGGTFSATTNNTYVGLSGGTGTVNVNGGSFAAHNLIVGGNGAASGTLNLNGGTLTLAYADGFYVDSNGTLNLNNGGSLPAANLRLGSGGKLNFNGGTGNAALNILAGGGTGGTVDLKGQSIPTGTWANLIASGAGAVLKNSSSNAVSIADGNTLWIWDGGTNLTIDSSGGNLQIDSRITSSGQSVPTGIIKTGSNNLVLTYAGNDYTGTTVINQGRIVLTDGNALGSTAGGTVVASGAQLMLSNVTVGNEALTISGTGLPSGSAIAGALRSFGANTYGGKITLGANAKIFGGSGTSLTVDVASGDAVDLSGNTLTIDGAGSLLINDGIAGAGGLTKEGSGVATFAGGATYTGTTTVSLGTLVVSNASRTATILPSSTTVAFATPPSVGNYSVLAGPLNVASLASNSVTGVGSGLTAILTNAPNLIVQVSAANGYSTWLNGQPTNSANQLAYAIGGATSPTATNGVASVTTVTSNTLSITAIVRTNDPNLTVYGQSILDLAAGTWATNDVTRTVPADQSGATPGTTQKQTFTTTYTNNAKKFLRLHTTLSNQ